MCGSNVGSNDQHLEIFDYSGPQKYQMKAFPFPLECDKFQESGRYWAWELRYFEKRSLLGCKICILKRGQCGTKYKVCGDWLPPEMPNTLVASAWWHIVFVSGVRIPCECAHKTILCNSSYVDGTNDCVTDQIIDICSIFHDGRNFSRLGSSLFF